MSARGDVLGAFAVYHFNELTPPPGDFEIIDLLTNTAAVVIERHRETEERLAAERRLALQVDGLEKLHAMSMRLTQMRELPEKLETILETMTQIHHTDRGRCASVTKHGRSCGPRRGAASMRRRPTHSPPSFRAPPRMPRRGRSSREGALSFANAAKYTNPGERIRIRGSREDDSIVLRVRDNGIGLTPEMRRGHRQSTRGSMRRSPIPGASLRRRWRRSRDIHAVTPSCRLDSLRPGSCYNTILLSLMAEGRPI
ncbi:MAG: ATP-binding protein [Thermoanaerobaculia bacterium]